LRVGIRNYGTDGSSNINVEDYLLILKDKEREMALKTEDIVKGVIELGNISKELEGLQKEISERKQEKGQLEHNIALLKKSK